MSWYPLKAPMAEKMKNSKRKKAFRKNLQLEGFLNTINGALQGAEKQMLLSAEPNEPDYPIVFVMGPLRSGTTLFMQWLANSGLVAYPTNLLSRFYGAPIVGAHIQLLLTDPRYSFREEFYDIAHPIDFDSENGKTRGILAPNEFWYFWRRFLLFDDLDWMPDAELMRRVDHKTLIGELNALATLFEKPFALKAMILNYNIPFLDAVFNNALFIQIKRNPVTNVASILDARRRQLGSETEWYSFKIPEYHDLKDLDPISQCAGQLHYINKAVSKGMAGIGEKRKIIVQYEDFCKDPRRFFCDLKNKLGLPKPKTYAGPNHFKESRERNCLNCDLIEKAIQKFNG